MPIGFIRRLARQSFRTTFVSGVDSTPTLTDNWTTEETATYDANDPADAPAPWGGTLTDLDRNLLATGSAHTALGMLVTFLHKPETASGILGSLAGAIAKLQVTYPPGSAAALEVWTLVGATWAKRRRVPLTTLARSGDVIVVDLTGPVLTTAQVDAYWFTLVPDVGTETLSWLTCHLYGICPNDPKTPPCPPGTPPEECDGYECDVDRDGWACQPPPAPPPGTDPGAVPPDPAVDPLRLPPILVSVANPTTFTPFGGKYFHNCPRPTRIRMYFGELPSGGSVKVTVSAAGATIFAEGFEQTISAPGVMEWTVVAGFTAANSGSDPSLPPAAVLATTDFLFTRQLAGSAFAVAGNLLDILTYFWTYDVAYVEVC